MVKSVKLVLEIPGNSESDEQDPAQGARDVACRRQDFFFQVYATNIDVP